MTMEGFIRALIDSPNFLTQFVISALKNNDSLIADYLRRKIYRTQCKIDTGVVIKNPKNFRAGQGCALYHSCYILNSKGKFTMGNNSHLGAFTYVNVCYGNVIIGDDVAIGPGTKIFAYSNHYRTGRKVTEERITEDVIIKNNIFIGANCTILPGTVINNNVIVGAGSVVKGTLEENSIYAGSPCRKIKSGWYE